MTLVGLNVAVASTLDDSTGLPCRTPPSGDEMTASGQTGSMNLKINVHVRPLSA